MSDLPDVPTFQNDDERRWWQMQATIEHRRELQRMALALKQVNDTQLVQGERIEDLETSIPAHHLQVMTKLDGIERGLSPSIKKQDQILELEYENAAKDQQLKARVWEPPIPIKKIVYYAGAFIVIVSALGLSLTGFVWLILYVVRNNHA